MLIRTWPVPAAVLFAAGRHLHDEGIGVMYPALLAALGAPAPEGKIIYDGRAMDQLPPAAHRRWKEFLVSTSVGRRYYTERQRIQECLDTDQRDQWLLRAATATSVEDVLGESTDQGS
ncbi:hypothetical protein [Frankia sp. R82]|uniref:hypothetical protein n=1 Tax=Frankia sp. R82 TaxID=2950553 RepID=UPI0020443D4B|nr:hypothetical protein [Frankia sp. R82]MCM3886674.1 hypothetical protein [Frankia sp. R82]